MVRLVAVLEGCSILAAAVVGGGGGALGVGVSEEGPDVLKPDLAQAVHRVDLDLAVEQLELLTLPHLLNLLVLEGCLD